MSSDDEYSDEDHGDSQRSIYSQLSLMNNVDSDEDICTEFDVSDRRKPVVEVDDFEYTVLTAEQIVQDQRNIIDEVNNVLHLSPQLTRIILNHYKWDKETLFEKYFESSPEEFFKQAQVVNPFDTTSTTSLTSPSNLSLRENFCGICYCPCDEMKGLGCGHTFCCDCWKQYLANKTCSEGLAHSITCPAADCDILVDDVSFVKLADNAEVIARYQQLVTNTFVECNPLMRWCPAPSCTNAIKVSYCEPRAVQCTCGHEFCFGCGENWHEPVSCILLKRWLKKNFEDSDTSNWIARNTKECPKCNATIEKDGGCNHMVCKNASCRYDFCWVCLGPWEPHGSSWYSCNRFDEDEGKQARQAQERCRSAMSRYLHYYNRYVNHMMSRRMEHKLYARVEEKMNEMQKNIDWIEVQFLKDAVDVLCQCRTTLLYSYVFAFYLKNNNQKIIFEDNQRDMEMATEKISEFLEREITVKNLCEVKQEVLDLSHYCRRRGTVLLCHVREGYEKDWWDFID